MSDQNPRMTRREANMLWNSLTPHQKVQFNEMMQKLNSGGLAIKEINMTAKEELKSIVLEPKEKPSIPLDPFMSHFDRDKRKIDIVLEAIKNDR